MFDVGPRTGDSGADRDRVREERDPDTRDRHGDEGEVHPRDVFARHLDLPRGFEPELVRDRDRTYSLNGDDTRTLSIVGAFRVVTERDLREPLEGANVREQALRHLQREGLILRLRVDGHDRVVALTERGRDLLERHRSAGSRDPQQFYSGADRARERSHDAQLYRAYLSEAEQLREQDARIVRVLLDRELKREYQRFLQERNRGDTDSDGRPDRSAREVEQWAREHDLPYFDEQVHFPDVRIEYRDIDGDTHYRDIEVTTEHYRGAHGAAAHRTGFSIHASKGGGRTADLHVAEEFL